MMPYAVFATLAVWQRHARVWRTNFWPSVVSGILNPLFWFLSFSLGLGVVIDTMGGLPYTQFVVPGMLANAALFQASFETTIPAYSRFQIQRTYAAILASPVRLSHIVAAEILWGTAKAMLSVACLYAVGFAIGGIASGTGALLALPWVILGSMCFASLGLAVMAHARSYEFFNYFFTFWVAPSFLICGIFMDISHYPLWLQALAWCFPITHLIDIIRPLMAGADLPLHLLALHGTYLVVFTAVCMGLAYRRLWARLFA